MTRFVKLALSLSRETQRGLATTYKQQRNPQGYLEPLGVLSSSRSMGHNKLDQAFPHGPSIDLQACTSRETSQMIPKNLIAKKPKNSQAGTRRRSVGRRNTQESRRGVSPKAVDLVEKVLLMPDVKEDVCKELDKWVASEGKFSIVYVKQALQVFKQEKHWNRIIQVSKWMLHKGEGKTLRTYEVLLQALDMHKSVEEAEAVWENDILKSPWSIPSRLVSYVLAMFERHHKPIEVIKLFTRMEQSGRNMDRDSIMRVAKAYEQAGFLEMKKQIVQKHNLLLQDDGETPGDNGTS